MRIATISDIHWRGITRHEEYTVVFNTLLRQLRDEVKPDYIFLLGDYFHTKTQGITPEAIDKIAWMFNSLGDIAPVYAILGNHDGNLANGERQDTISPIVAAMNNSRIKLLKKSGNYQIEGTNINLGVLSCFDEPGWSSVKTEPNMINIGLFHGAVKGAETDSDWVLSGGEIDISTLEQFDFAMLGDIHKCQFLGRRSHGGITREMKPWIGYPGSLIQQNYGEEIVKGFLVWDIKSKREWNVEFVPVPNSYQFHTVEWKGNVRDTISEALKVSGGNLTNRRVRVSSGQQTVSSLEKHELYLELKNTHKATEVVFKTDSKDTVSSTGLEDEKGEKATSLRNNPEAICELYESFLNKDYEGTLTETQRKDGKAFVLDSLNKIIAAEDDSPRDVVWSIKSLEFDNLFRYGSGNKINFQNLKGITGIFGPNKIGKSAVLGALMFGLFNTTDRGPVKSSYIINKRKKTGFARVAITVSGVDYVIERTATKASKRGGKVDEEKAATKLSLFRINKDGSKEELVNENSESRTDTDKVIRKLIGTPQDFLLTAFANQGGITRFIDEGATQRKAVLNRFLDLDIFEKIYKLANEGLVAYKGKVGYSRNTNWQQDKSACEDQITVHNMEILAAKAEFEQKKARREKVREWLQEHGATRQAELRQRVTTAANDVIRTQGKIGMRQVEKEGLVDTLQSIQAELTAASNQMKELDLSTIEDKAAKLQELSEEYFDLRVEVDHEQSKQREQLKNVKKLDLVPCGDSFPMCHYIKDAYEDRKLLETQKKVVDDILVTFQGMKAEVESLQQEKIEEQLKLYHKLEKEVSAKAQKIEFCKANLANSEEYLASLEQDLRREELWRGTLLVELSQQEDLGPALEENKVLTTEITLAETKIQQLYIQVGKYTNQLESIAKEEQEAMRLVEEQKIYASVAQAFSKNGIPAYVLKNKLPEINTELANILGGIVPFRIALETEPGSNSLDVMIDDDESGRVIELASGMERMIASLAIRVALISLLSLPKLDMLIQDEGYGSLDAANIAKVIELLHTIKNRFRAILVISHIDEIKEAANSIINITDNGTESNVVF